MPRGKYVVIEGNDGTGKSTQVDLLASYLKSKEIETFVAHEPAGTPMADAIREIIKNGELERSGETNLLLFTAARHEIWQRAEQKLMSGSWVISARNYLSTEVYQGYGEGVSIDQIHQITDEFTNSNYMNPDFTFVLTLSDQERTKRIRKRGEIQHKDTFESRDNEFQDKLNEGYKTLAKRYNFTLIDASQSIDNIQTEIRQLIGID